MSFKRDGDDSNLLSKLRKRRISELLAENIPKDEATLLSNGRFTCIVCNSVPIFDTVNMLMVHRQGKKHLANQHIYQAKQRELRQLIAVRKHQQFRKDGTTSIPMAVSSSSGVLLSSSSTYDPRVKKAKLRPNDRKPRLNIQVNSSQGSSFTHDEQNMDTKSAFLHDLRPDTSMLTSDLLKNPKSSVSSWKDVASQQLSGPVMHSHQLKHLFANQGDPEELKICPYQRRNVGTGRTSYTDLAISCQSESIRTVNNQPLASSSCLGQLSHTAPTSSSSLNCELKRSDIGSADKYSDTHTPSPDVESPCRAPPPLPQQGTSDHSSHLGASEKATSDSLRLQKLRQLQGSGWKKDWDGKWIKDEDAEFDSDEEPPDIQ